MLKMPVLERARHVGQLLWIGFEGTSLSPALVRLLKEVEPGGIVLFARNIENAPQVRALTDALYRTLTIPPFIALDQEGGRVNRLRGIIGPTPACFTLANGSTPDLSVRRHAEATSLAMKSLGFNVNFAPVLDLSGPRSLNGIGDRSYGEDADRVAHLAGLFARVHLRAGVIPVGKHFPGLGGARRDAHLSLPMIRRSRARLLKQDLLPYRRLRGVLPIVMIGHACYPALQGKKVRPASLSSAIVSALLRARVGYRGLALTDDLVMGAIDQSLNGGEQALAALDAGGDGLMFCRSEERIREAHAALQRVSETDSSTRVRLLSSWRRIRGTKSRFLIRRRRARYSPGSVARSRLLLETLEAPSASGIDPTARS